jgi:hypothetical protein
MSAALYIVVENKPEETDVFVNGKALAGAEDRLVAAAQKLGVPELMSFFSQDPEEAADFMDTDALPEEQWFRPNDGLRTIRALLAHFAASAKTGDAAIVSDLREFETVLQRLQEAQLRWHLAVDF